jgi:hypothetical protein
MFFRSRKGSENIDTRMLFTIFIFIGSVVFLGGLVATTTPMSQDAFNVTNVQKPPTNLTGGFLDYVFATPSFIGYIFGSLGGMSSSNPAIVLILIIPITTILIYIFIRLIKPFS